MRGGAAGMLEHGQQQGQQAPAQSVAPGAAPQRSAVLRRGRGHRHADTNRSVLPAGPELGWKGPEAAGQRILETRKILVRGLLEQSQ
jgi:hypothetical protein